MISTLLNAGLQFWNVLGLMAPYLLLGFLLAGILSVLISPEMVERHLGGAGIFPVAKASLFGVPLPLCSCGVIPVAASLRKHGASPGATTAFLLSTPQTGVDSILVTYGLLGPVFAVFRPLAALVTGIIGGGLVALFDSGGKVEPRSGVLPEEDHSTAMGLQRTIYRALSYGFVTLPREIGSDLLVGLILAGAISALVPREFFAGVLGAGIGAMLVMMLLGIPVYVCASASVPLAAAFIAKGISPGAAFVFLMTGPATNAATIMTIRKIMGWRTVLIYLGTVAVTALGWGLLLDRIFTINGMPSIPHLHEMPPGLFNTVCALALLAILGLAVFRPSARVTPSATAEGKHSTTLSIGGMTCNHCVESVRGALLGCPAVSSAEVDLKTGMAVIRGGEFKIETIRHAVEKLGYEVTGPES